MRGRPKIGGVIMARCNREVLSGLGVSFEIIKALTEEVADLGGNPDDDLRKLLRNKPLCSQIAELIVDFPLIEGPYPKITVDYRRKLCGMIKAGKYDWADAESDITADLFEVKRESQQEVEIVFVHFRSPILSDEVISKMKEVGYRPIYIKELLSFGICYPELLENLLKKGRIAVLGSICWRSWGDRYVPVLSWNYKRFSLNTNCFGRTWSSDWYFAAVRE